jgi:hypothetical protein
MIIREKLKGDPTSKKDYCSSMKEKLYEDYILEKITIIDLSRCIVFSEK